MKMSHENHVQFLQLCTRYKNNVLMRTFQNKDKLLYRSVSTFQRKHHLHLIVSGCIGWLQPISKDVQQDGVLYFDWSNYEHRCVISNLVTDFITSDRNTTTSTFSVKQSNYCYFALKMDTISYIYIKCQKIFLRQI